MAFKFYKAKIKEFDKDIQAALEQTGEALHTEVINAEVMPFDVGTMQNEDTFIDYSNSRYGSVSLITTSPQARRLYYHPEYDFQTINNSFAGAKWFEPWMKGGQYENFVPDAFSKLLKRRLK